MAASVHSSIRLDCDLTGELPTNEYGVTFDGLSQMYEPAIVVERSLTGTMHVHRILTGSTPMVFDGFEYVLLLTRAEKTQLAEDLGKLVYFMPHYRDESDVDAYRSVMLFRGMQDVRNLDPHLEYYHATIILEEATGRVADS